MKRSIWNSSPIIAIRSFMYKRKYNKIKNEEFVDVFSKAKTLDSSRSVWNEVFQRCPESSAVVPRPATIPPKIYFLKTTELHLNLTEIVQLPKLLFKRCIKILAAVEPLIFVENIWFHIDSTEIYRHKNFQHLHNLWHLYGNRHYFIYLFPDAFWTKELEIGNIKERWTQRLVIANDGPVSTIMKNLKYFGPLNQRETDKWAAFGVPINSRFDFIKFEKTAGVRLTWAFPQCRWSWLRDMAGFPIVIYAPLSLLDTSNVDLILTEEETQQLNSYCRNKNIYQKTFVEYVENCHDRIRAFWEFGSHKLSVYPSVFKQVMQRLYRKSIYISRWNMGIAWSQGINIPRSAFGNAKIKFEDDSVAVVPKQSFLLELCNDILSPNVFVRKEVEDVESGFAFSFEQNRYRSTRDWPVNILPSFNDAFKLIIS